MIKAAMKNLGVPAAGYTIATRAAGIISRKYMQTGDPTLLKGARKAISKSDVVIFGGAPLFNYAYQSFYLRTIKTLEIAQEFGVPVLFSSIGVEPFDPSNAKSLQLKDALALPCVRQITTRDDFDSLQKYVEGTNVRVAHVSDPAVFADVIFDKVRAVGSPTGRSPKKRIGLVVTRSRLFKDNQIEFSEADQRKFWIDVIELLTERGYDYKLFTTGHFTDEVFLDAMVRAESIPLRNVAFNVNSPEELINELSASDGVIAYRLHASITSFAYAIPSIGLSWNFKVPDFYKSVGYGHRALSHQHWNAAEVVSALEDAMSDGVTKNEDFLASVYTTLFTGLKDVFAPRSTRAPYSYAELRRKLPRYEGTSAADYRGKMQRKLRRTYEEYQKHSTFHYNKMAADEKEKS
ncbi:polysaccharide pyruvyl transferase family protein [Salinibacterium sp. SWN139]|nr:polysaccharide pyruvyl transferase family protein [Salinibacterium sp. SWN139]MBH0053561.1 polysaccharide pyruvyl transferase family protein [Salinibacterium sp. SWN139]